MSRIAYSTPTTCRYETLYVMRNRGDKSSIFTRGLAQPFQLSKTDELKIAGDPLFAD